MIPSEKVRVDQFTLVSKDDQYDSKPKFLDKVGK